VSAQDVFEPLVHGAYQRKIKKARLRGLLVPGNRAS
jgi:hypothetical protein